MDCRYPVTCDINDLRARLCVKLAGLGAVLKRISIAPAFYIEERDPRIRALEQAYREVTGDNDTPNYAMGGLSLIHISQPIAEAYGEYMKTRAFVEDKRDVSLMDLAIIGMKALKKDGRLNDLDESDEINACSIVVEADVDGHTELWLVMFKNETHNHPTEIEPFGGAATCLGGAIRDPLSGRSYVYQCMRLTGAGDPRTPFADTLEGKLPQKKICLTAAGGYSSYGNQIGLAAGKRCV